MKESGIGRNLKECQAGNHLRPYKMFRMKEEKEPKRAKDEKEQSAKERANERGKEREKEKKMGIKKTKL